ncbi:MAG: threonylcarbamoyl-AMP synthase [Clostridia bacterium]|nr:threonylcarbamoyl-AMP synthase [Clostridia bacterium]
MNTEIVYDIDSAALARAGRIIREGGIVAFPTETVYGLGGNALDPDSAKKIYAAKGRPSDNPLIVHLSHPGQADEYCFTNDTFRTLAKAFMPGPLTVILPKKDIIPPEVTGGLGSVAIRVPADPTAHAFIKAAGRPIAAPSANISGRPSPTSASHVIDDMDGRIDMILAGRDCEIGLESTIVSVKEDGSVVLLRPGKITPEQLGEYCRVEIAEAVTGKFEGKPLSPGMKYKHYSPRAELYIIKGNEKDFYGYVRKKPGCGVIRFDEDRLLAGLPDSVSIGSRDSCAEQAHRLFDILRGFDKREDITEIYARTPDSSGVGLAVWNRLLRAAGFKVIDLT